MYKDKLYDTLSDIVNRINNIREEQLTALNLKESQYNILMHTEEGRKKLKDVLQRKPEFKPYFIRLDTLDKVKTIINNNMDQYLPF